MNRILIDLTHIYKYNLKKSIPIYSFRLIESIPDEYKKRFVLFVNKEIEGYFHAHYPEFELKTWKLCSRLIGREKIKEIYLKYSYIYNTNFGNFDKVLIVSDLVPYTRYKFWSKKKYVLIHDQKSCEYHDNEERNMFCYDFYHELLTTSDKIIAISEYTKKEIGRIHKLDVAPISVVYNCVVLSNLSESPKERLPQKYILFVNTLQPYKNALTLAKAFCMIKDKTDCGLVFVGQETEYWENEIYPLLKENKVEERVVLLQSISNEQLKYCYERARLFVTTSTREGFGYTPIEAAMCGCPVISTTCESLPEVTDNKVIYYEPYDDCSQLAACILKELENPTSESSLSANAQYFSQKYSPRNMFDHYKKILFD